MWFHKKHTYKDKKKKKPRKSWSKKRKALLAVALSVVLVTGGVIGRFVIYPVFFKKDSENNPQYMEGYVSKGNLEMTTTVSGTTTNGTSYQLYDLDLQGESDNGSLIVSKVCVSEGDTVKKGSTLMTLTQSSVNNTKKILENAVKSYQTELVEAKIDYEQAVVQAKADYQTNLLLKSTANTDYKNSLEEYASAVKKAKKNLNQVKKVIQQKPEQITSYQTKITAIKKQVTTLKKQSSDADNTQKKAKSVFDTANTDLENAKKAYQDIHTVANYLENYQGKSNITEIKKKRRSLLKKRRQLLPMLKKHMIRQRKPMMMRKKRCQLCKIRITKHKVIWSLIRISCKRQRMCYRKQKKI